MEAALDDPQAVFMFEKDISEVYRIRLKSHRCQWATITINNAGEFSAITDCGNFNYNWGGYGSGTFKDFLIRIFSKSANGRGSYVYEKISDGARDYVDCEKTVQPMKKEFVARYRELYKDARQKARWKDDFDSRWAFRELRDKARSTWEALEEALLCWTGRGRHESASDVLKEMLVIIREALSPSGEQPGPSKSTMGLMTKEEDGE